MFGLGTYRIPPSDIHAILQSAIDIGYRSIDTAAVYRNEAAIGTFLADLFHQNKLTRSDIHITTKLSPRNQGYESAYNACLKSMDALQVDYLDVYLIHWPGKQSLRADSPMNKQYRADSWCALERLYEEGKCKRIGVSNYTVRHLEEMTSYARIQPHVLQVEFHPLLMQRDLRRYCKEHGIQVQAYSSFGEGRFVNGEYPLPVVETIAKRLGVTTGQVLLKWALKYGVSVIPKASSHERLKENFDAQSIELSDEDVRKIDAISENIPPTKFCWDPETIA